MRAFGKKRFLPVALLIPVSIVVAVSLSALPTRHLMADSAHGGGHTPEPSVPKKDWPPLQTVTTTRASGALLNLPGSLPATSPTPHHCSSCPPPSPRRIYAPAIELPEAGSCEIVLNSRSPHPIDV